MRRLSIFSILVLSSLLLCHFQAATFALEKTYIVYMGSHKHGPDPKLSDIEYASTSHYELVASVCKSMEKAREKILYSYTKSINGLAAVLEEVEAQELAKHPNVVSVFLDKRVDLQTTHSWNFLGLEGEEFIPKSSLWRKAKFGQDVIIANIDSGVWPESKSFSDEGIGPIPSRWRGFCQNDDNGVRCNRKLISARYFNKAAMALNLSHEAGSSFYTSRDFYGHGTHTLSTAAGNFVSGANVYGLSNGTAKGGSPNARVAAYKACWDLVILGVTCMTADVMAAMDAAIYDGVDVISVSLGSKGEFYSDATAIAAFHAVQRSIVVVGSAGNNGTLGDVNHAAPWILTVGAATIDRQFTSFVTLGNGKRFNGVSLSTNGSAEGKFYTLISAMKATNKSAENFGICSGGTLDPELVKGKILVCPFDFVDRNELEIEALRTGAVGMIVTYDNKNQNKFQAYHYMLPAADLNFIDSELTSAYINSSKNPIARIRGSRMYLNTKPAPAVAGFSCRGPNPVDESILKPDVVAPGVNIIAANCSELGGEPQISFAVMTGTSMAAPHVAGVVGLLRAVHPDWSPAAIHSAIITTARTLDNNRKPLVDLASNRKATPFARGAGFVNPNNAVNPGLVYDSVGDDYLNYLCALGYSESQTRLISSKPYSCPKSLSLLNFNYPSITVPNFNSPITINRIVKNVGSPSKYTVHVKAPKGVRVSVKPKRLTFTKIGEEKTFQVTLRVDRKQRPKGYVFGRLTWSDGKHKVRSPLIVKHQNDVGL